MSTVSLPCLRFVSGPLDVAKLKIYSTRKWTRVDKNGGRTVPDDSMAKSSVYALFRDNAVINAEADIVDDGLSACPDLYAKIFPSAIFPEADFHLMDDVHFKAYQQVKRKLWQWAGTGVRSHCQETCEMEGLDYVMVEKKVFRASRDGSTGTVAPTPLIVRFFTSDPDLIFELSSQPASLKFVKAAEEAAKHLQMNTRRHPELITRVAKETQSALKRSAGHLTRSPRRSPRCPALSAAATTTTSSVNDGQKGSSRARNHGGAPARPGWRVTQGPLDEKFALGDFRDVEDDQLDGLAGEIGYNLNAANLKSYREVARAWPPDKRVAASWTVHRTLKSQGRSFRNHQTCNDAPAGSDRNG